MNVVISNRLRNELKTLNIPIGKELIGNYSIDDLVQSFNNFEFTKLIIDLSAIKDLDNLSGFQRFASSFNINNVIFVVNGVDELNVISKLIPFGIYNFATNNNNVIELMTTPNTYKEVAHYHDLQTPEKNRSVTMNSMGKTRVLGFKNLAKESGATSLIYMSKMLLEQYYSVLAIEVNKEDFGAFKDRGENFVSVKEADFVNELNKGTQYDIVLVDINDSKTEIHCSDVFYLLEPSIIKLDRFTRLINFQDLVQNKKIILNKSFLNSDDLADFEYEGRIKVFYNLPPMNDRAKKQDLLLNFYKKIGLNRRDARKLHRRR